MKQQILQIIYECFEAWSSRVAFACRKGCSVCCTQSVTMTQVEGDFIVAHIQQNDLMDWFEDKLALELPDHELSSTTNEYARACLEGESGDPGAHPHEKICPFLENGLCSIYASRPFSCRCFASQVTCGRGISASVPDYYLSGATAVSQIIEHLDQNNPWGNMLHLLALRFGFHGGKARCLTSRPLPGFLISETDYPHVAPLIEDIFAAKIGTVSVEDVLNGRQPSA